MSESGIHRIHVSWEYNLQKKFPRSQMSSSRPLRRASVTHTIWYFQFFNNKKYIIPLCVWVCMCIYYALLTLSCATSFVGHYCFVVAVRSQYQIKFLSKANFNKSEDTDRNNTKTRTKHNINRIISRKQSKRCSLFCCTCVCNCASAYFHLFCVLRRHYES